MPDHPQRAYSRRSAYRASKSNTTPTNSRSTHRRSSTSPPILWPPPPMPNSAPPPLCLRPLGDKLQLLAVRSHASLVVINRLVTRLLQTSGMTCECAHCQGETPP